VRGLGIHAKTLTIGMDESLCEQGPQMAGTGRKALDNDGGFIDRMLTKVLDEKARP
jgi:hypothetical protein